MHKTFSQLYISTLFTYWIELTSKKAKPPALHGQQRDVTEMSISEFCPILTFIHFATTRILSDILTNEKIFYKSISISILSTIISLTILYYALRQHLCIVHIKNKTVNFCRYFTNIDTMSVKNKAYTDPQGRTKIIGVQVPKKHQI